MPDRSLSAQSNSMPRKWDAQRSCQDELDEVLADLHQVHLNYHHMVDEKQRYHDALCWAVAWILQIDEVPLPKEEREDWERYMVARELAGIDGAAPDQERHDG